MHRTVQSNYATPYSSQSLCDDVLIATTFIHLLIIEASRILRRVSPAFSQNSSRLTKGSEAQFSAPPRACVLVLLLRSLKRKKLPRV
ncbi:hypothetical protein TNCV_5021581 [Trichonephila clavipes]|nr:hypothetical protein TNCV_5021581 [Trichonephila clavipes]